jgi:hypothetical protein
MEAKTLNAGTMSPLRLLAGFAKGRIVRWIAVAAVAHVVLIGLLSMGYIRDRWIDPEGAAERKAAALAAQEALKKEAAAAKAPRAAGATGAVAGAGATTAAVIKATGTSTGTPEQIPDDRKDTPVVKRITEKAQPGEIPKQPDDLGISINDTTVH